MRLSTIACVLAVFAFGTHGYASLFSFSANVRGPATWPTFVDARHVITTAAQPLSQSPALVEPAMTSVPAPTAQPHRIMATVVNDGAARVVPPLPRQSPPITGIKTALLAQPSDTPRQKAHVTEIPAPARRSLPVARPKTSGIVTGSIGRSTSLAGRPVAASPASKPEPPVDFAARSSLGGPKPTTKPEPALAPRAAATKAGAAATTSRQLAALTVPTPGRQDIGRRNFETSPRAATLPSRDDVGLPARSPFRGYRPVAVKGAVGGKSAAGRSDPTIEPKLLPLGQSLAAVRGQPFLPRPSRSASRLTKTTRLNPPLLQRVPATATVVEAAVADSGAANVKTNVAAIARARNAAARKRANVRRAVVSARPVKRRAYKVVRRAARSQQASRRSARIARRQYARSQWKRQALGESLF